MFVMLRDVCQTQTSVTATKTFESQIKAHVTHFHSPKIERKKKKQCSKGETAHRDVNPETGPSCPDLDVHKQPAGLPEAEIAQISKLKEEKSDAPGYGPL